VICGVPAELTSAVGTVQELLCGFVEVLAPLVRYVKFDGGGTPDFYISDVEPTVFIFWGVSQSL